MCIHMRVHMCMYTYTSEHRRRRNRQLALPGPDGDEQEHSDIIEGESQQDARELAEDDPVERMLNSRRRRKRLERRQRRKNKKNKKKNNSNNNDHGQRWYQGSNALRMRQVWITCAETDTCRLNVQGFLDCNLITACQPDGILP